MTIVTQQSADNGSAYFRALQYVPLLHARGFDVTSSPANVPERRLGGSAGAALLLAEHAERYIHRGVELRRLLADADVVLVQRGAYPIGPSALLRNLERFTGRVVFDLDDATFLPTPTLAHRSGVARWVYKDRQSLTLLNRADCVIVSTPELDDALPGRRADIVLPTIPDVQAYPTAVQRQTGTLRLGWIGSEGNIRYLDPLRGVLGRLAQERVAELTVVTASPWSGPSRFARWKRSSEAEEVAGFEVGLMPLPDSPYTRAKAGFKLLQYMAAGCAVIASPVGINGALVQSSGAGLVATSPPEWEQAIRALARAPERRAQMGAAGKKFVTGFADRGRHADILSCLLRGEDPPPVPVLARVQDPADGSDLDL